MVGGHPAILELEPAIGREDEETEPGDTRPSDEGSDLQSIEHRFTKIQTTKTECDCHINILEMGRIQLFRSRKSNRIIVRTIRFAY